MIDTIIAKLSDITLRDDIQDVNKDEDMLTSGLLDSFGYVQLLTSLEEEFSFTIGEEEQFDERLRNINGIIEFCNEKINSQ